MIRWNRFLNKNAENPRTDAFLEAMVALCRKYGLSIRHEDNHGAFVVERFNRRDAQWLMDAMDSTKITPAPEFPDEPKYRVSIGTLVAGGKTTYVVCLDRPDRPTDASVFEKGRITPFQSENFEHASAEAEAWAEFFGTTVVNSYCRS